MDAKKSLLLALAVTLVVINFINAILMVSYTGYATQLTGSASFCVNHPPTTVAIAGQTIAHNSVFTLQVESTDSDGHGLLYTDDSSLFTINSSSGLINFTPLILDVGNRTIEVIVNDFNSSCPANNVNYFDLEITNSEPTLETQILNQTWEGNVWLTGVNLRSYFSDSEGDYMNFTTLTGGNVTIDINNNPNSVNNGSVIFKPDIDWFGTSWVVFYASDTLSATPSNNVTLTVELINLAANLVSPNIHTSVVKHDILNFTSQINCTGGECGNVSAYLKVDNSQLSESTSNIPFYSLDENPYDCGAMLSGHVCNTSWRINATGALDINHTFLVSYFTTKSGIGEIKTGSINVSISNGFKFLDPLIGVFNYTIGSAEVIPNGTLIAGVQELLINNTSGQPLVKIPLNFNQLINLSDVIIQQAPKKIVTNFLSLPSGIVSQSYAIYLNRSIGNGIIVCPGAKTLLEVNSSCNNAVFFSDPETLTGATRSNITITRENGSYKISGLILQGGAKEDEAVFFNCFSYVNNESGCIDATGCKWVSSVSDCVADFNLVSCNTACFKCNSQASCTTSPRTCVWDSPAICHENFTNFTYGSGGVEDSSGFIGFNPIDCRSDYTLCDSSYNSEHNFMNSETICFDNVDDDSDGKIDCADDDCRSWFECTSTYNASSDTTVPRITHSTVDAFTNFVSFSWSTTEPTNGTLEYYGSNSNCASQEFNKTEFDNPLLEFDDYLSHHYISLEDGTDTALVSNTSYYYKLSGFDQSGLLYRSACLNFTTASIVEEFTLQFQGLNNIDFDFGSGFAGFNLSEGTKFNLTKNVKMKFPDVGITFESIDLIRAKSFDFSTAFVRGNSQFTSDRKGFVGMSSKKFLEMKQNLGLKSTDNITLSVPSSGQGIFKCDDTGTICKEVTNLVTILSRNFTHTTVSIPVSLGFSSYLATDNSQVSIWDQTDNISFYDANKIKYVGQQVVFYANYTNVTSGVGISGANQYCDINFTGETAVTMDYNSSNSLYHYNRSFLSNGTFLWGINCNDGDNVFSDINTSDTVVISPNSSSLVIWDQTDTDESYDSGKTKYPGDLVVFYANYTNRTSGDAVSGANQYCDIEFSDLAFVRMTYNSSNLLYFYPRQFSSHGSKEFTTNCYDDDGNFADLSAQSSANISENTTDDSSSVIIVSSGGGGGGSSKVEYVQDCEAVSGCTSWMPANCDKSGKQIKICNSIASDCNVKRETEERGCECKPQWMCTVWNPSECGDAEYRERSCSDVNNCGLKSILPTRDECVVEVPQIVREAKPALTEEEEELVIYHIVGGVIAVIVLTILLISFVSRRKRGLSEILGKAHDLYDKGNTNAAIKHYQKAYGMYLGLSVKDKNVHYGKVKELYHKISGKKSTRKDDK